MDDFWSRADALESRRSSTLGAGRTLEENLALDSENARIDRVIDFCNKSLRRSGQVLERHNPLHNPAFGWFVMRSMTTREVVAGDLDPDFIARRLTTVV